MKITTLFLGVFLILTPSFASAEQIGIASWYSEGSKTASGERFHKMALTAAHRTAKFNSYIKVTNLGTGASVVARVNDRGPFIKGRIIDLSKGSAIAIGCAGLCKVKLEFI